MKINKILMIISIVSLIGGSNFLIAQEEPPIHIVDSRSIIETVKSFTNIGKGPVQTEVCSLLDELALSSVVIREGTDADQRPVFVNAQSDFERAIVYWLQSQQVVKAVCMIHTPAPATPLCTNGEISTGLVDPAILNDPERLLTVKKRPDIIRDYLQEGGRLLTIYPKEGRVLRSPEQLAILDGLVKNYPDRLQTIELDCSSIPHDLIGATYIITFSNSKTYVLSLRSYQANSPTNDRWAIWFGSITEPAVANRLDAVLSFINDHGFHETMYTP